MIPPNPETQAAPAAAAPAELSEFESLLNKEFKARDVAKAVGRANGRPHPGRAGAVGHQAGFGRRGQDHSRPSIAEIDKKLSEQINLIMHHEDFKALEGTWRGLHYLVNNTETDEMLKIRVLNISKKDLKKTLKKFEGTAWDQSPLFKKLYEEEFGSPGGQPYGCLIGDYYFDHSPRGRGDAGRHGPDRRGRARAVHRGRGAQRDEHGLLAGIEQPARPDQDFPDRRIRRLALAARLRGRALHRA